MTPDKFISVAEETGVIVGIGAWVIQQACIAARDLTAQTGAPIQVAVNISTRQFRDPNLVNTVRRCIRESGIDPAQLEVEITETMLMDDAEAAAFTVERLHELGIKIAIDDFGTGYSSLNYLKRFPIDTVKIDRSFVMDIPSNADDMAITAAVISMAHRLSLVVVAEGVETVEQLKFLQRTRLRIRPGLLLLEAAAVRGNPALLRPERRTHATAAQASDPTAVRTRLFGCSATYD